MIYDLDGNVIYSAAFAIERGATVTGSFKLDCWTGWQIASVPVDDLIIELKHSAGSYVDLETVPIDLGTWNGTQQVFTFRMTASATPTRSRRAFPFTVSRITTPSAPPFLVYGADSLTYQGDSLIYGG